QAEDGIRDRNVTGVQTCALPIYFVYAFRRVFSAGTGSPYAVEFAAIAGSGEVLAGLAGPEQLGVRARDERTVEFTLSQPDDDFRSEERRVGKGCRRRGWPGSVTG